MRRRTFSITMPEDMLRRVKKAGKARGLKVGPQIREMVEAKLPEIEREITEKAGAAR